MALEQNIPQIMELQFHGKDIKKLVVRKKFQSNFLELNKIKAIYNASPIANGFLNIEGTGTVEEIIQTLLVRVSLKNHVEINRLFSHALFLNLKKGLITGFFGELPGTDQQITTLGGQTLAELAVSVSDQAWVQC